MMKSNNTWRVFYTLFLEFYNEKIDAEGWEDFEQGFLKEQNVFYNWEWNKKTNNNTIDGENCMQEDQDWKISFGGMKITNDDTTLKGYPIDDVRKIHTG